MIDVDREAGLLDHDIGDFDAAGEQRQGAQARHQPFGGHERLGLAGHAEPYGPEVDRAGRKKRHRHRAEKFGFEPRHRLEFGLHGRPGGIGRNEK